MTIFKRDVISFLHKNQLPRELVHFVCTFYFYFVNENILPNPQLCIILQNGDLLMYEQNKLTRYNPVDYRVVAQSHVVDKVTKMHEMQNGEILLVRGSLVLYAMEYYFHFFTSDLQRMNHRAIQCYNNDFDLCEHNGSIFYTDMMHTLLRIDVINERTTILQLLTTELIRRMFIVNCLLFVITFKRLIIYEGESFQHQMLSEEHTHSYYEVGDNQVYRLSQHKLSKFNFRTRKFDAVCHLSLETINRFVFRSVPIANRRSIINFIRLTFLPDNHICIQAINEPDWLLGLFIFNEVTGSVRLLLETRYSHLPKLVFHPHTGTLLFNMRG